MRTRLILTASAVLVAAVVLLVTLWAGPKPARRGDDAGPSLILDAPPPPNIDQQIATVTETPRAAQVRTETYFVERFVRDRIWQFFGDSVTPLPNGLAAFEKPGARIFLSADQSRALEVTADRGTFDMPDNQPRRGEFQDNVVVSLYDSQGVGPINFTEPGDALKLRLYLDSARFEQDIGQIESDGPVHLTGPRLDFTGTGLVLNFNQRRNRIERLEVRKGKELRFKPEAAQALTRADEPQQPDPHIESKPPIKPEVKSQAKPAAAPPQEQLTKKQRQAAKRKPPAPQAPQTLRPVQFYRAVFHDDVRIASPDAVLESENLEVIFSLDRPHKSETLLDQLGQAPAAAPAASFASATALSAPPLALQWSWLVMAVDNPAQDDAPRENPGGTPGGTPGETPDAAPGKPPIPSAPRADAHPTMAPPGEDDVVIHWTGPLEVRPLETQDVPPQLDGPRDQMLCLVGDPEKPARIHTTRNEIIVARRIGYTTADGQVTLEGTAGEPFTVDAPDLGVLRGAALSINQRNAEGSVTGPGELDTQAVSSWRSKDQAQRVLQQRSQRSDAKLRVAWRDRLDLTFFHEAREKGHASQDAPATGFDRLRALRSARFTGDVDVAHPDFHLNAGALAVTLDDPQASPIGRQQLTAIDAEGDVTATLAHSTSRDASTPAPLGGGTAVDPGNAAAPAKLDAHRLNIGFADRGDGRLAPDRLLASGDVRATEPGQTLEAQEVEVEFAKPSTAAADAEDADGNNDRKADQSNAADVLQRVAVARVRAQDAVRVTIQKENVTAQAQRMIADPRGGQVEFFGSGDAPARLARPDGSLSGEHLILQRDTQKVFAQGPGRFATAGGDATPPRPDNVDELTITWTQAMEYDHAAGAARFRGDAAAVAESDADRARLTGGDLRVTFAPATATDGAHSDSDKPDAAAPTLRSVEATGDPVFLAESFAKNAAPEDQERRLESRFRLAGPSILFDHPTQQVQVIGAGTMLVEDYRAERAPAAPAPAEQTQAPPQAAAIFGRGQTLFTWAGTLRMDLAQNDLRLADDVQMVHRSSRTKGVVQLDCQKLFADLSATGGLDAWTRGQALQPELRSVRARGGVMVREGDRRISSDELQYDGSSQSVLLTSKPPRVTQVVDVSDPLMSMGSEGVRWWLATNRLEVIRLRAGRVPLQLTPTQEPAPRRGAPPPPSTVPHRAREEEPGKPPRQEPATPPAAHSGEDTNADAAAAAEAENNGGATARPATRRRR